MSAANAAVHGAAAHHGGTLAEQLHHWWPWAVHTFITRPLGIPDVYAGTVVAWLIIAAIILVMKRSTRQISLVPTGMQNVLEYLYESLEGFFMGITGPDGKPYLPLVITFFMYIFCLNLSGLIPGVPAPTADLSHTVGLALCTFGAVHFIAISKLGFKNWFLHLCGEPLWMAPLMFPIHVVGELAKPLSLSLRLFGNMFGEDQVIINLTALGILIFKASWLPIPVQFPLLCFGIFTSFVQALVFSMLTTIYIVLFVSHHGDHGDHEDGHGQSDGHNDHGHSGHVPAGAHGHH